MSNFQWETEEEIDWDGKETAVSQTSTTANRWRYLFWGVTALVLLIAVGVTVTQQLQQRIAEGQAAVREDLLASVQLVTQTAESQDRDVFALLLSGRDPDWADQLDTLVSQGLFRDRSLLNLTAIDDPTIEVDLSPDLLSAEVIIEQTYRYEPVGRAARAVTLRETAVYRKGENRWLLAPPEPDFWGERQTVDSEHFIVQFNERDAQFARQFAEEFSQRFTMFCQQTDAIDCSPELSIVVILSNAPESVGEKGIQAPLLTPAVNEEGIIFFDLPSPTLFGEPINAAGTAVLSEIYAINLLRGILNLRITYPENDLSNVIAEDCCAQPLFRRALLDFELAKSGLISPNLDFNALIQQRGEGFSFDDLTPLWAASSRRAILDQEATFYAAIDFLQQQSVEPATTQLFADMGPRSTYYGWLEANINVVGRGRIPLIEAIDDRLDIQIAQFPFSESMAALPEGENLYAICSNTTPFDEAELAQLVRFDPDSASELLRDFPGFGLIESTASRNGYIVLNGSVSEEEQFSWQTERFVDGEATPIFPTLSPNAFSFLDVTPDDKLIMFHSDGSDSFASSLVAIDSCEATGCQSSNLAGATVWSPNGERSLIQLRPVLERNTVLVNGRYSTFPQSLTLTDFLPIFIGNENGLVQEASELGHNPFWIDNGRFSYIRLTPRLFQLNSRELVILSLNSSEPDHILTSEQLAAAAVDQVEMPSQLLVRYAAPNPSNPQQLFIVAERNLNQGEGALFQFDLQSGDLAYLFDIIPERHTLSFSPNGRFLVVEQQNRQSSASVTTLILHDIENQVSEQIPLIQYQFVFGSAAHEWSPDGNRLAFLLRNNRIGLIDLEQDQRAAIRHNFGTCSDLAWIHDSS